MGFGKSREAILWRQFTLARAVRLGFHGIVVTQDYPGVAVALVWLRHAKVPHVRHPQYGIKRRIRPGMGDVSYMGGFLLGLKRTPVRKR
jgi:hypothetical protein